MDSDQILQNLFCFKHTSNQVQLTSFLRRFANAERFFFFSVLSEPLPLAPLKIINGRQGQFVSLLLIFLYDF